MPSKNSILSCTCGSNIPRNACCGPYLDGTARPSTATQCMRSRYAAFVENNVEYLLASWHPMTRPRSVETSSSTIWLGLTIKQSENGAENDSDGVVEFVARYRENGKALRLHEVSQFKKESGEWFYFDGNLVNSKKSR
jgi:SEC-C motif-containing protein